MKTDSKFLTKRPLLCDKKGTSIIKKKRTDSKWLNQNLLSILMLSVGSHSIPRLWDKPKHMNQQS